MKQFFASAFDGNRVALYYVSYIILSLILGIILSISSRTVNIDNSISFIILYILTMTVIFIAGLLVTFFLLQHFLETLSLGRDNFSFNGYLQEFAPKMAIWFGLTVVTLGFYFPWLYRNITDYFAENTVLRNEKFKFNGSGFVLFVITLIYIIFIIIYSLLSPSGVPSITDILVTQFFFMILSSPLIFLVINWFINFDWGEDKTISYEGNFLLGIGIITINILLTMITLGLYAPAAYIRIYRHFANNIVIRKDLGLKTMELGFKEDNTMEGFIYIIGQYLLIYITMGIYTPWALAKIIPWFVGETYLVDVSKQYDVSEKEVEMTTVELDEDGEQILYYDD